MGTCRASGECERYQRGLGGVDDKIVYTGNVPDVEMEQEQVKKEMQHYYSDVCIVVYLYSTQ